MSDELELNDQLVARVKAALKAHDQRADDDTLMIQYLAALIGYMMADQAMPSEKRHAALQQLSNFSGHVMQQTELQAGTVKPSPEAFGIWKPHEDKAAAKKGKAKKPSRSKSKNSESKKSAKTQTDSGS